MFPPHPRGMNSPGKKCMWNPTQHSCSHSSSWSCQVKTLVLLLSRFQHHPGASFWESEVIPTIVCSSDTRCIAVHKLAVSCWVAAELLDGCHSAFLPVNVLICFKTFSVWDCSSSVSGGSFTFSLMSCTHLSFSYFCWVIFLVDYLTWSCTEFLADIMVWMCLKVFFIGNLPLEKVFEPYH